MLTLGAIALAAFYIVGAALCRTCRGYDEARVECERDREWWRGLEAKE